MSGKKTFLIIIGIILSLFVLWRVYDLVLKGNDDKNNADKGKQAVAIEVSEIVNEPIRETGVFTGTVKPVYQYVVAPKVSGRIITINKRIGDKVKSGETVAKIDDAEYQQAVFEAEANLKIAKASLEDVKGKADLAKQEFERAQSLKDKGIASSAEFDAAVSNNTGMQAQLKLAEAQVEQREAALNSAKIRLGYTILSAPEPGFVGERFVDEGSLLSPNSPVLTIVGIDRVIVRTTIIERDYGRISPGQDATVEVDAFPSEKFIGSVSRIAPMLQENSRVASIEIDVDNKYHKLKPGMFARVKVILAGNTNAQVIPARALVSGRGSETGSGVFIVNESEQPTVKFVPVKTGIITQEKIEIISPVLKGKVVILGQHLLTDGSPVILHGQGKSSGGENNK